MGQRQRQRHVREMLNGQRDYVRLLAVCAFYGQLKGREVAGERAVKI